MKNCTEKKATNYCWEYVINEDKTYTIYRNNITLTEEEFRNEFEEVNGIIIKDLDYSGSSAIQISNPIIIDINTIDKTVIKNIININETNSL